jgi:hypothetical protein
MWGKAVGERWGVASRTGGRIRVRYVLLAHTNERMVLKEEEVICCRTYACTLGGCCIPSRFLSQITYILLKRMIEYLYFPQFI